MNHRSRPDLPSQWRSSSHLHQLKAKSQPPVIPAIPDPRFALSSPPESPPPTFSFFAGKKRTRAHSRQPPSDKLQQIEDEEYAPSPHNPYHLPPASVIAVEFGSQSNRSLSRTHPLNNPVIPDDEDSDVTESRTVTISTFFSPDLDARLPRTPDSDDNMGRRGRPVAQKQITGRSAGGAI